MRLLELRLVNFRQFHGEQRIEFANAEPKRNVTVIHGYNGAGKTALLNAFIWCLYGRTTDDLEAPDRLVNEQALSDVEAQAEVSVSVRLRFRARDETYIAERSSIARRTNEGSVEQSQAKLTLWRITATGESEPLEGAQNRIDQLLPEDLYPFFFFNGERVERLASPEAYDEVEEGVKTLLDVEIYERSVRHLRDWVHTELNKELRQYGNEETQQVVDEETRLVQTMTTLQEHLATLRASDAELMRDVELIEQRQRETSAIREFVAQREAAQARLEAAEDKLNSLRNQAARSLSKDGYLAFGDVAFARTNIIIGEARQRGELPARVKPQFVDDLLHSGECICGRPIEAGSQEREKLVRWKEGTGLAQLEESISRVSGGLPSLRKRRQEYFEEIERVQGATSDAHAERRRLRDQLDELGAKIGDSARAYEAAELEQKRLSLVRKREDARLAILHAKEKVEALDEELRKVRQRVQQLRLENSKAALVQHQLQVVARIADAMEQIYAIQKEDVREDLARSISGIWSNAAVKDYEASVSEDFRLELTKRIGGVVQPVHGASTGEKQVLALSFVGSLVRKAKQNEERNREDAKLGGRELVVGGEYPLVMDSPFGALEDDYRQKVAEWVPTLAGQVIVMASKTQWRDEVETAMRSRIGREYILELHTPKENADRTIEIQHRDYPYVRTSDRAVELTVIQEVG